MLPSFDETISAYLALKVCQGLGWLPSDPPVPKSNLTIVKNATTPPTKSLTPIKAKILTLSKPNPDLISDHLLDS